MSLSNIRMISKSVSGQAGIIFIAIGLTATFVAATYRIGTPARMGPGFFPFCLGLILVFVGLLCILGEIRRPSGEAPPIHWRPLVAITAAVVIAALLLLRVGLVVAIPCLVIVATLARPAFSIRQMVVTAIILTGIVYAVFILGLNMQIPLITW